MDIILPILTRNAGHFPDDALYRAIDERYWNKCRALLQSDNVARLVRYKGRYGHNALHKACRRNAPIDVVEAIHYSSPKLVERLRNVETWCRASEEVVLFLLSRTPSIASQKDVLSGRLPLHYVVDADVVPTPSVTVVRRVLTAHPEAARPCSSRGGDDATEIDPVNVLTRNWRDRVDASARRSSTSARARDVFVDMLENLLMARAHGTVVRSCVPGGESWSLVREAARCHAVPTDLVGELWRTTKNEEERDGTDGRGDSMVHLLCARPGDYLA